MFYAIEYAYGENVLNQGAGRSDRLRRFRTKYARDRWVDAARQPHYTASGYRTSCSSRHPWVRARRYEPESWSDTT